MAEFKLGRIKFVWQGEWTLGTPYVVDDVVTISGKSYICVLNHTAGVTDGTFAGDLNIPGAPKWNLLSDGTEWTGDWLPTHYYDVGSMVKYGGMVYICNTAHTSATNTSPTWLGLEDDLAKWDQFAESFNWTGAWTNSTKYRLNDFVSYGGVTYVCNVGHISASTDASGLEADQGKWDIFNKGVVYLGDWTNDVRYKVNDIVKYGASTWICVTNHTSSTTFDDAKFSIFVEGLQFESSWDNATIYQIGDTVTYGGYSYIAKRNNVGSNPSTGINSSTDWAVYTTGFNFRGDYLNATAYKVGDVVRLGGYTYLATADTTGNIPPNGSFWTRLNSGVSWTNPQQTYTAVVGTTIVGVGENATFDVTRTGATYAVVVNNGGDSFVAGDKVKILGTQVGGLSPVNDLEITVSTVLNHVITGVTVSGISTSWTPGHDYVLGDVAFYGASSYICVLAHTASSGNRPDNDLTATYWNLMASGSEAAVLTVAGDTVYYGANGPTRLPIGADGQLLRVTGGYPTWAYYGVINNVVYVAPTGTDSEDDGWGLTIDKPWRTVRFACDQVRVGYQNRNAAALLKKNKQFIMKEISNWVTYTYTVTITASSVATNQFTSNKTSNLAVNMPIQFSSTMGGVVAGTKYFVKEIIDSTHFTISATQGGLVKGLSDGSGSMTGTLAYDSSFCERDTGLLVEAVLYDLTHGGTDESTKAAKAYYTTSGSAYINSNFGQQIAQTVAAYNYLKTLIANVLGNMSPAIGYQVANGITTGPTQVFDTANPAEDGTATVSTNLLSIVTNGILAGTASEIPTSALSNTTVFIKTGTYFEVLPIIVPRNTAVVGDELRGTVVSPKAAIANLVNDKPKTVSALNRLKAIIPNLIANNTVAKTTGNTDVQYYVFNNNESIVSSSVNANVSTINTILSGGSAPSATIVDPSNLDTGFFNARRLIVANTQFLKDEVTAFMAANYSSLWSSLSTNQKAACTRDIGYIVDALQYDLTYGGNLETVAAARAYYSKGTFVENSNEKTAALAVQTRLNDIIDNIVTGDTAGWTKSVGNSSSQVTSGTAGSSAAGIFAQARITEMYNCINTGITPVIIEPSTSWVSPSLVAARTSIQAQKTLMQAQAITWITSNYPSLTFDQALCSRDVGYIIDALCYDLMFAGNFRSIKAGASYLRALTSTSVVTTSQLAPTTGVVSYVGLLAEQATQGTDVLTSNINTMTNIIANGTAVVPSYVYPDPVGYDNGYYNARRLVLANKTFLQSEVAAYMVVNYSSVWTALGTSGQAACTRDIGYIIDALAYDLTYQGNLATVIASRAYYSNNSFVEASTEKTAALAVQARIKDIIDNIVIGNTAGWTKSVGNSGTQVTSGIVGSAGAATFAQARIQEVYDCINSGTTPTTVAPSLTWVASALTTANTNIQAQKANIQVAATDWINKTYPSLYYTVATCQRDVGYIIDALCYDMMFGSNFLSIQNAMSYYRSLTSTNVVLTQQLQPTLGVLGFVGAAVKEIKTGVGSTVGRTVAVTSIEKNCNLMYDIINNGISTAPNEVMPNPASLDANFAGAKNQIANNYTFLKAEISAYLNVNYNSVWTALGVSGQASCQRDVGYILDALRYDLTYGGNTQSLIVGSSYYSYINLVIASSETTAILASYNYLKSIIDDIASGNAITRTAGNTQVQSTSGAKDTVGTASTFAQARVQNIYDWINNGTAPATITPTTTWVDPVLVAGVAALQAKKSEIQKDALGWVNKYHQELTFTEATCSRDVGYIIDAIGYDMMFGSNFASTIVGKSYYRAISSAQTVLASQKTASLGMVNFLKYKLKNIAVNGGVAQITTAIDDVINTINGGAVPRFAMPDYTGIDSGYQAARTLIQDNKSFLQAEVIAYMAANYSDTSYNRTTCSRDVGYVIDALSYDLAFGSNYQSVQVGLAYLRTQSYVVRGREKEATIAAMTYLKGQVAAVVAASSTAVTSVNNNMTTILAILTNGLGSVPSYVYPDPTGYDTGYSNARRLILANKAFIVNEINYYLNVNYNSVWTSITQATCSRDTGYLVDALIYDLTYGGNLLSLIVGNAYYSFSTLEIASGEVTATLAAYARLKAIVGSIAQATLITRSTGNVMTQDVSGTAGSSAAATFAQDRVQNIYDIINAATAPATITPVITWTASDLQTAFATLQADKATLQGYVINFVNETYSGYDFNQTICARDVGYIVDSLRFDLTYGGNLASRQSAQAYYSGLTNALQIDSADRTASVAAYTYLKSLVQSIAVNSTVASPLQTSVTQVSGTAGSAGAATAAGTLMDGIINTVTALANLPAAVNPSTAWVDSGLTAQQTALSSAKASIQASVISYIGTNYPNLVYDSATCSRDVGLIIDAIGWDMVLNTNFMSVKAGMSYYRATAAKVVAGQKKATLDAFRYMKGLVANVVTVNATALARVKAAMTIVIDIADKGIGKTPEVTGTVTYNNNQGIATAAEILRVNKSFLESEATAWISSNYGGTTIGTDSSTNTVSTKLAHHLSVGDPITFTIPSIAGTIIATNSTGNLVTLESTTGMFAGQKFSTVTGDTIGNLVSGTVYYIKSVVNSTQVTLSATFDGATMDPGTGTGILSVNVGTTVGTITSGTQYYILSVPTLTSFTFGTTSTASSPVSVTTDTGAITVTYAFDAVSCRRDMGAYVSALIDDLQYTGNYASTYAARLYNNAVGGSEMSDMYWVRNSTGVRNMTLSGLNGQLTDVNDYGTKRPTAGAYVSLDPGFGQWDTRVWITTRSCYSQNVTMFGTGCVGGKIDGALHAGGNRSTVANDFTTIISDGIGIWCTGSNSLTELVSVFNYYGYAGYLAELGGKIRATNGNSSYGTYGVVAEGVDTKETPLYGTVNNQAYEAQITTTVTDGTNQILRFEYGNAGQGYTNTVHNISGTGYNAAATADEFRDGAVFESRIIDLNDSNGYGGTSYVTQTNAAQTGDTTSITIAATDTALSNTYNGMRIQITAGTGVGQFANILTYGNGSKIATVYRDMFTPLTVTATAVTNNLLTVASTATLTPGMPIWLTSTANGLTANTLYYVRTTGFTSTQFSVSTTGAAGTAVTITTTGSVSITLLAAGWDHIIPGTTIKNALDLTTGYTIEPRVSYTAPGFTATARTLNASTTWNKVEYGDGMFVAIPTTGTTTGYSRDGATWATAGALPSSASWTGLTYGGGEQATATAIVGGLGGRGAILTAVLGVPNTTGAATADQVASVTIVDGGQGYTTPPTILFTPTNGGSGAKATAVVLNGKIVSVTVTIPGSGYTTAPTVAAATDRVTKIVVNTWGKNFTSAPTITITGGGSPSVTATAQAILTNSGVSQILLVDSNTIREDNTNYLGYSGAGYTSTPTVVISDSVAKVVAIANGSTTSAYTTSTAIAAGTTWTAGGSTGKTDLTSIVYGGGMFVAVGGTASAVSSTTGTTWISRTIPTTTGTWNSVTYGNGTFVAISTNDLSTAYSTNGTSWTQGGNLPSSTTWTNVAYGNGRFVAIASGGRSVAYSLDKGVTWTAAPIGLPTSTTWTRVRYGEGLFVAVASGGTVVATSPFGINWTLQALPSSSNWNDVHFGNPSNNPTWVAISSTSGTTAATLRTGATALGRVKVAGGVVTEVRMVDPGSGYPKGAVSATTTSTNLITVDNTINLVDSQPIEFFGTDSGGLTAGTTYYVIGSTITSTQFKVSATAGSSTAVTLSTTSPSGMTYRAGPIWTVTDTNHVKAVALRMRLGDGALGNPSFSNRGANNTTATSDTAGDGYSDLYQASTFINVSGLFQAPQAGANVEFASLPGLYFKLVTVTAVLPDGYGKYTATFQINPGLTVLQAPKHGDLITTRIKYSQVRLTGHDFLYIGTGGYTTTNFPGTPLQAANQAHQELYSAGGRVFFTSTDQDGNFNVGNLFGVQQATGTATLNASAFNLAGLNSLQLGSVELGIGSAIITQFSTDPYFTANSDSIVPTQRAIRAYITSQIGGGQSSLNVNTLTSGVVYVAGNSISTTTGVGLNVTSKMNFTGGIDGAPVALGFFMQR